MLGKKENTKFCEFEFIDGTKYSGAILKETNTEIIANVSIDKGNFQRAYFKERIMKSALKCIRFSQQNNDRQQYSQPSQPYQPQQPIQQPTMDFQVAQAMQQQQDKYPPTLQGGKIQ